MTIPAKTFRSQLDALLRETFEGPPPDTWSVYLDSGGGLFQLLDDLSAAAASRAPKPGMPTVAAHVAHLAYYNDVLRQIMEGSRPTADWPGSWRTQKVSAKQWAALRRSVRASCDALLDATRRRKRWSEDAVSGTLAILVHTTYHLAAIRSAIRFTK
jgi:hypothetical protein